MTATSTIPVLKYLSRCRNVLAVCIRCNTNKTFNGTSVEFLGDGFNGIPACGWIARWLNDNDQRCHAAVVVDVTSHGLGVHYGPTETDPEETQQKLSLPFERLHSIDAVRVTLGGNPPIPDFTETARTILAKWGLQEVP